MNRYTLLSILAFISGLLLIVLGVLTGEVQGGLFLIFPFVIGSGIYATLGILLIIASFFLFMLPLSTNPIDRKTNSKIKGGGILLLGPIPIIIGSNWKIALLLITIAIILLLITNYYLI
jgi:uncharacterized protein (TIGR00304 family)